MERYEYVRLDLSDRPGRALLLRGSLGVGAEFTIDGQCFRVIERVDFFSFSDRTLATLHCAPCTA